MHCLAKVVRAAQLDRAILQTLKGLGLSKKQPGSKVDVPHLNGTGPKEMNDETAFLCISEFTLSYALSRNGVRYRS